ncbi:high affinity choline transporter 1-like [Rhinophrynus dorsalis]
MAINVPALLSVIFFFVLTLAIGVWAAWKTKKLETNGNQTEVAIVDLSKSLSKRWTHALAVKSLKSTLGVGPVGMQSEKPNIFSSFSSTWVGGSYINGTAEIIYLPGRGLMWLQAPLGFAIALTLAAAVRVIMDIQTYLSIIISACIVIIYTFFGGLYSVAYTDVIQMLFMVFGLCLGSIPWQVYFQRVLSAATTKQAKVTSAVSGILCFAMAIPSALVGAVAASTDWNQTNYGLPTPYERGDAGMILPIVLQHLCPVYVSVAGLGAIAAAVMSSADSALLSSSSLFGHNIYKKIIRKKASEREVRIVMRIATVLIGSGAAGLAFLSNSIYDLWFLCGELVFALILPQFFCALFVPKTNTYGSAAGFLFGFIFRVLSGINSLKIPPIIHYPWCTLIDGVYVQLFPHKTTTMLISLATLIIVSRLSVFLFERSVLPVNWDIFNVMKSEDAVPSPTSEPELLQLNNIDNHCL